MIQHITHLIRARRRNRKHNDFWRVYDQYMHSPEWKAYRRKVLKRDRYTCQRCGLYSPTGYGLQVHHLTYARVGHERLSDCIVLCMHCHDDQHPKRKRR